MSDFSFVLFTRFKKKWKNKTSNSIGVSFFIKRNDYVKVEGKPIPDIFIPKIIYNLSKIKLQG